MRVGKSVDSSWVRGRHPAHIFWLWCSGFGSKYLTSCFDDAEIHFYMWQLQNCILLIISRCQTQQCLDFRLSTFWWPSSLPSTLMAPGESIWPGNPLKLILLAILSHFLLVFGTEPCLSLCFCVCSCQMLLPKPAIKPQDLIRPGHWNGLMSATSAVGICNSTRTAWAGHLCGLRELVQIWQDLRPSQGAISHYAVFS